MSDILQEELVAVFHGLELVWTKGIQRLRCYRSDSALAIELASKK